MAKNIKSKKGSANIFKTMDKLKGYDVKIGIPQSEASRPGEPINNAELAYIHTNGSPINNILARPFLQPSVWHYRKNIATLQKNVIRAVMEDNMTLAVIEMEALGLYGQNIAKQWFTNPANGWPANKPETIKRKGSDKPLIDTGALRQAISYVVDVP